MKVAGKFKKTLLFFIKIIPLGFIWVLLSVKLEAQDSLRDELLLPRWEKTDLTRLEKGDTYILGKGLFIPVGRAVGSPLKQSPQKTDQAVLGSKIKSNEKESDPLPKVPIQQEQEEGVDREIPKQFWGDYFTLLPSDQIIDPQRLLSEPENEDVRFTLESLEDETNIPICILLLEPGQILPEDLSVEELAEKWYPKIPTALIIYFLGLPEAVQISLGPSVNPAIKEEDLIKALGVAVQEAQVVQNPVHQLERFIGGVSLQLFWIETRLERYAKKQALLKEQRLIALHPAPPIMPEKKIPPPVLETRPNKGLPFFLLLAPLSLIFIAFGAFFWKKFKGYTGTYLFPEREFKQRLGGKYAGGSHAFLSFEVKNKHKKREQRSSQILEKI